MKNKSQKIVFYTIYEENETNGDLVHPLTFETLDEIAEKLQTPKQTIKNAITRHGKINNQYVIFKDVMSAKEL